MVVVVDRLLGTRRVQIFSHTLSYRRRHVHVLRPRVDSSSWPDTRVLTCIAADFLSECSIRNEPQIHELHNDVESCNLLRPLPFS